MTTLRKFFSRNAQWKKMIPDGFLDALMQMYDYTITQEIKEALYYYNEEQIDHDLKNYIFALNFEEGEQVNCIYTGDRFTIGEEFFRPIEARLFADISDYTEVLAYRREFQKEYTSRTLTQELRLDGRKQHETRLYRSLYERLCPFP